MRLIPPSKNSATRRLLPGPSCLLDVSHGVVIVPVLTLPQTVSLPAVVSQSTPAAIGSGFSEPSAPPSQR